MLIDVICLLLLIMAVFKGLSQGLIVALLSFISFIIGIAAALKLSALVAAYLHSNIHVEGRWLPFISFIIVFAGVVILVRWIARMLKTAVNIAFLGWLDALGGILLYVALYFVVFSVILFFAVQMHLISYSLQAESKTYPYIKPWGPKVINSLGSIIPFFSNMFAELKNFFRDLPGKVK